MKLLNLGCGNRYHPEWTNINFTSTGDGVIAHNLTQGIPFPDNYFDVVYHSHVLEHFPKAQAEDFIKDCYRVLRPQGILRVVVPDLEEIARTYLAAFDKVNNGFREWDDNYQWILLEMYDQTVRNTSGGEMLKYLSQKEIFNQEFIINRCGIEAKNLIQMGKNKLDIKDHQPSLIKKIYRFLRYASYRRETVIRLILGEEYEALKIGRFRLSGEVHQWMYDSYSLSILLKQFGFKDIVQRSATESYVNAWNNYNLDTESDGTVYKSDSLYMEGIKY
ncbi:methyltransferase domain-containing protein [Aphanizomenon sp. CS-733/32]|uniref:class I SAM-dependent methyltransferase n=1 Tax=Aphanizomenon sp. CS-733/32 TaxID=3021715 RepID=UPI00232D5C00|nr:methyltransferase domain-containing protein [Aphanizomenon sp. CS-733/32]MDB9308496.1 methyltransferase domain-containing protein [Aphanizomenon sp. CS-733/32]